uniref:ST8 alpha-N-acetyl-neuraminide alpha-2,8-sialyltransferase 6 n=1 Tax=Sander lucioperca TaxID=283035 RepID=A0A8C9YQG1_SANLU
MRGQLLKSFFSLVITLCCLGSLLTTFIWYMVDNKEVIDKVQQRYSQPWKKQEDNYQKFRSLLSSKCHGFDKAIITQANTPVGSKLVYDGEKKRTLQVTPEIFSTFVKENPFPNKTWDTCAVVGNGGILTDSGCGKMIDSAQFVIRCNLPPLDKGYEKHVGMKTDLVTANPSIFLEKYGALMGRRRPFVESLRSYGNSLLLLPAFSYGLNTPVCLRAVYSIEDFKSPTRPVSCFFVLCQSHLCNVHLYGFWPFSNHPHGLYVLTNHYYDDRQTKTKFHAMPAQASPGRLLTS